jgi:magnesium transporter
MTRKDPNRPAHASRVVKKRGKKAGTPPGSPVHTGPQRVERMTMSMIRYGPNGFEERQIDSPDQCFPASGDSITWLNIDGLHDTEMLATIARCAGLHPLVVEDIVSIGQRPKQEEYEHQHFIVLRMLLFNERKLQVEEDQISIILGPNYVLSFQEAPGDVWDPVRNRIRTGKGQIRQKGADYLAYALMDAIVDEYFDVVETVGDLMDRVETAVIDRADRETIVRIHHLKGELLVLRKAVWPLRDLFNALIRDESRLITAETRLFLRDAYDHAVQVIDTVETMRDVTASLIDLYLSSTSIKMNEIMKVLTVIGTLFIPLTFLVGVYGMNFDWFPELHWKYSYPVLWAIMIATVVSMLVFFRRRGWF